MSEVKTLPPPDLPSVPIRAEIAPHSEALVEDSPESRLVHENSIFEFNPNSVSRRMAPCRVCTTMASLLGTILL